jgi:hypothetical protein
MDRAAPPISSVGIPVRRRRRRPGLSEQVRHPLADVVASARRSGSSASSASDVGRELWFIQVLGTPGPRFGARGGCRLEFVTGAQRQEVLGSD